MREDLLKLIRSSKDVTNAVILTHNIDFIFLQSVVLPALRKCGQPALTVFADAGCAERSYESQGRFLSGLGTRYRVVPVTMKAGFRFHPKALLLSGPKKATLAIGSGNLTFGGWRENGEIWSRFDAEGDDRSRFQAFHHYLDQCVGLVALNESIKLEVGEAFNPASKEWASELPEAGGLLGRAGSGESLIEQIRGIVAGQSPDHLYICAPYFDQEGEALKALTDQLAPKRTIVLIQPGKTNLLAGVAANLGTEYELTSVFLQHTQKIAGERQSREALLHAKFYCIEVDGEVTVLAGSANCSRAALTIPGASGNAELMAVHRCSIDEFQSEFLDELEFTGKAPELSDEAEETPDDKGSAEYLRIGAARMEGSHILVAFSASAGVEVSHAELDDTMVEIDERHGGHVGLKSAQRPRVVRLIGKAESGEISSYQHWIDNEIELRASARDRSLAESIDHHVRSDAWTIGAWTNVLTVLYKHLQYMPKTISARRAAPGRPDEDQGPAVFQWEDVFAESYGLGIRPAMTAFGFGGSTDRISSLRAMLLRWFGIGQEEESQDVDGDGTSTDGTEDESGGDLDADMQEALPVAVPKKKVSLPTDRERERALTTVRNIAKRMSKPEFLAERGPEMLAGDLKVASVLLRAGLVDGWLSADEFFCETLRMWLPLFFNASNDENMGWLEKRYRESQDPTHFAASLRSPELAAALGCWALSAPASATSPDHALFDLASALGVARLPWLWQTGGNAEIAKEIAEILAHARLGVDEEIDVTEQRWRTLIRRGFALNQLEAAVGSEEISRIRDRIPQAEIRQGELLWQGTLGFCVAQEHGKRAKDHKVEVKCLRQQKTVKKIAGLYTIPLAGLLEPGVLDKSHLDARARSELLKMLEDLGLGWGVGG